VKKRNPLQDAIDQYESDKLEHYEAEYEQATKDAHRYEAEGRTEDFYRALLSRKELRAKIAHAKICRMRTKEVR
jgi:hypothetical protein